MRTECPDYDGVPSYGGPCWTCQDGRGPCPLDEERTKVKIYFNPFRFSIEQNNEFIRKGYEPMPMRIPTDDKSA